MTDALKTFYTINKYLLPIFGIGAILLFIYTFWQVIMPFFLSFIIAYLLNPIINSLEYKAMSRTKAISFVYIIIFIILGISFTFLVPILTAEIETLRVHLPEYIKFFQSKFIFFETKLSAMHPYFQKVDFSGKIIEQTTSFLQGFINDIPNFIGSVFSFFYIGILIPFITFFLLKDGYSFRKNLIKIIPNKYFEMLLGLIFRLEQQLGNYIRGKLLQILIIAIIASIGLIILDVPYAIFLGIFAGIINVIPYIGPIIGSIPAMIVVFLTKQTLFPIFPVAILFGIVQLVDNIILQPVIVAKSIDMHPLLVIASLTFGGYVAGIWGMILGVPLIGMLKVLIQELLKEIKYRIYAISSEA